MPQVTENPCEVLRLADGTPVALIRGESRRTATVRRWLETKNDESRFGLTRAPFLERLGVGAWPKSALVVAPLRAALERSIEAGTYHLLHSDSSLFGASRRSQFNSYRAPRWLCCYQDR